MATLNGLAEKDTPDGPETTGKADTPSAELPER